MKAVRAALKRVFAENAHRPLRGRDLRDSLVDEGLTYEIARTVPGEIQRGHVLGYTYARRGRQEIDYVEDGQTWSLPHGFTVSATGGSRRSRHNRDKHAIGFRNKARRAERAIRRVERTRRARLGTRIAKWMGLIERDDEFLREFVPAKYATVPSRRARDVGRRWQNLYRVRDTGRA